MNESVPKSYKIQNGCHNCSHVCVISEYDCDDRYYCTRNKAKPIQLVSDISYADLFKMSDEEFHNISIADKEFRDATNVEAYGSCDE